jgi:heterokaryon incompatibility protein (HET)
MLDIPTAKTSEGSHSEYYTDKESNLGRLRLVERHDIRKKHGDRQVFYTTLSHVWGDEDFVTLTSDNLSNMKEGIALNCLPQSFQDAVIMTQRIGLHYIWIDSLWYVFYKSISMSTNLVRQALSKTSIPQMTGLLKQQLWTRYTNTGRAILLHACQRIQGKAFLGKGMSI